LSGGGVFGVGFVKKKRANQMGDGKGTQLAVWLVEPKLKKGKKTKKKVFGGGDPTPPGTD